MCFTNGRHTKHEDGYLVIYWIELWVLGIENRPLLWQISLLMGYVYYIFALPEHIDALLHSGLQNESDIYALCS